MTRLKFQRRFQDLLAYLLLHRAAPQSRAQVAFAIWPDSTDAQAQTNLRTLLVRVRRVLPDAERFLHVDAHALQWYPDAPYTLDVLEFERSLATAAAAEQRGDLSAARHAFEAALAWYRGDLLPNNYDDWLLSERERLCHVISGDTRYFRDWPTPVALLQALLPADEAPPAQASLPERPDGL